MSDFRWKEAPFVLTEDEEAAVVAGGDMPRYAAESLRALHQAFEPDPINCLRIRVVYEAGRVLYAWEGCDHQLADDPCPYKLTLEKAPVLAALAALVP